MTKHPIYSSESYIFAPIITSLENQVVFMKPIFSVIIPLFNKEKYIRSTLSCVLAQHFSDYEVIIVNDGSEDRGGEAVKEFDDGRIRYYETENKGVSSARNLGISLAQGQFIAFLDADDYWYPHYLEKIYSYIEQFPDQKVFATAIEFEYKDKVSKSIYSINKTGDYEIVDFFSASYNQAVLFTSASVFQRYVFELSGVFDTSIKRGEDTDLWIRIGLHFQIVFIWNIGVRYAYDANSLSRSSNNVKESASFSNYSEEEHKNAALKKFLDYNRYSLAIKSKLSQDRDSFNYFFSKIDFKNLPCKKRILLFLPTFFLSTLVVLKNNLMRIGIGKSVFVP